MHNADRADDNPGQRIPRDAAITLPKSKTPNTAIGGHVRAVFVEGEGQKDKHASEAHWSAVAFHFSIIAGQAKALCDSALVGPPKGPVLSCTGFRTARNPTDWSLSRISDITFAYVDEY